MELKTDNLAQDEIVMIHALEKIHITKRKMETLVEDGTLSGVPDFFFYVSADEKKELQQKIGVAKESLSREFPNIFSKEESVAVFCRYGSTVVEELATCLAIEVKALGEKCETGHTLFNREMVQSYWYENIPDRLYEKARDCENMFISSCNEIGVDNSLAIYAAHVLINENIFRF
jgi:hypothetical protein